MDVEEGSEIFADYGSGGMSFLLSVGILAIENYRPPRNFIAGYKDHWLCKYFLEDTLPQGPVHGYLRSLLPRDLQTDLELETPTATPCEDPRPLNVKMEIGLSTSKWRSASIAVLGFLFQRQNGDRLP